MWSTSQVVHSPKSRFQKGGIFVETISRYYISSIRYPLSYMLTEALEAQQEIGAHGAAIQAATNEPLSWPRQWKESF